jgi:hypothetical protein
MSNEAAVMIEKAITKALAVGIAKNVAELKAQCQALRDVVVYGLFLENPLSDGTVGKRRDVNGPRINIVCNPNIPKGYGSSLRTCKIDLDCITQPDSDPDQLLAVYCYQAVRKVFDNKEFALPEALMELRGYLITEGGAGITDDGFVVTLGVRMEVFVKQQTGAES